MSLFATMSQLETENKAFALLHIIERRGSTPRHNASMLVTEDGNTVGTIGGGMVERLATERAQQAIAEQESCLFSGKLTRQGENAVGSDCGGAMTIYIAVYPRRPALFLLGGGHVNREVAKAAVALDFSVTVADTWPGNLLMPDLPCACRRVGGDNYAQIVPQLALDEHSYVVIATNHEDWEALVQVIQLPFRYLGMLSSRKKAQQFRQKLNKEIGIDESVIDRLRAPVGLNIGAETPAEIAISIMAELVQVCHQGKLAKSEPAPKPADEAAQEQRGQKRHCAREMAAAGD